MSCAELIRNAGLRDRFDSHSFDILHPDGRRLVAHWFRRAEEQLNCDPADSFEPIIYAWWFQYTVAPAFVTYSSIRRAVDRAPAETVYRKDMVGRTRGERTRTLSFSNASLRARPCGTLAAATARRARPTA